MKDIAWWKDLFLVLATLAVGVPLIYKWISTDIESYLVGLIVAAFVLPMVMWRAMPDQDVLADIEFTDPLAEEIARWAKEGR